MQSKITGFVAQSIARLSAMSGRNVKAMIGLDTTYGSIKNAVKLPSAKLSAVATPKELMSFVSCRKGDSILHKIEKSPQPPTTRAALLKQVNESLSESDFAALVARKNSTGKSAFSHLNCSSVGPLKELITKKVQMSTGHIPSSATVRELMSFRDTRFNDNVAHKMLEMLAGQPIRRVASELSCLKQIVGDDNFAQLMCQENNEGVPAVDLVNFNYGPRTVESVTETQSGTGRYYGLNEVIDTHTTTQYVQKLDLDSRLMNIFLKNALGDAFESMPITHYTPCTTFDSNEAECISYH